VSDIAGDGLESFARELARDVEDAVRTDDGSVYSEEQFTRIVLERLADEGAVENPIPLYQEGHFARTRYKITGFALSEDEERLLLVTTVYSGDIPPKPVPREQLLAAIQQAVRFFECSCKGLHEKIEPSNTDASDLARRIYENRAQLSVLRVVVLSDGITETKAIDVRETNDGTRVLVDLMGIERLYRILGQGMSRDDIVVALEDELGAPLPCLRASDGKADYEAYLTAVPGSLLAALYEKYGTHLLELNVRAFLGLRGKKSVNAGLRTTIREAPHRFLAYNNGIVATVDDLELVELGSGAVGIRNLRGLQIVNGGQTTASLHRARRQDKANLDGLMVPAKIIRVSGAELDQMVSAVSRSANSQNTVQPADFSANDPFHVEVEKLANNTWLPDGSGRWFYERARGSYTAAELRASYSAPQKRRFAQETPKQRRFSKTDLAKYLNAWDGAPHLVSFGNQKNFQAFMQGLKEAHPEGFVPDAPWFRAFVAKAILFRTVQKIIRDAKFPAYQANIAAYSVSALSWRTGGRIDFELVWAAQSISAPLRAMMLEWAQLVDEALRETAGTRMPSEWAKKAECRDALRDIDLPIPTPLPPELSAQSAASGSGAARTFVRNDGLEREDLERIAAVREISAETWLRVAQWGAKTKAIHKTLVGISRTMAEYAIGGWEKSPSAKQAKWAIEAWRRASEAKFEVPDQ
jgi:hypothetical protein